MHINRSLCPHWRQYKYNKKALNILKWRNTLIIFSLNSTFFANFTVWFVWLYAFCSFFILNKYSIYLDAWYSLTEHCMRSFSLFRFLLKLYFKLWLCFEICLIIWYRRSREVRKLVFRAEGREFGPLEGKEILTVFV